MLIHLCRKVVVRIKPCEIETWRLDCFKLDKLEKWWHVRIRNVDITAETGATILNVTEYLQGIWEFNLTANILLWWKILYNTYGPLDIYKIMISYRYRLYIHTHRKTYNRSLSASVTTRSCWWATTTCCWSRIVVYTHFAILDARQHEPCPRI